MRILCVAEKNSAAKAIAGLLSSNNFRAVIASLLVYSKMDSLG